MDYDHNSVGTGLYLTCSYLNHSCSPNCVVVFEKNQIILKSIENIQENTELTISYIELAASSQTRKKMLETRYFFTCNCKKCEEGINDDLLTGKKCLKCQGLVIKDECVKCKEKINLEQVNNELSKAIEYYKKEDDLSSYNILSKYLHPMNEQLLTVTSSLMKKCIDKQDFKSALQLCIQTLGPFECNIYHIKSSVLSRILHIVGFTVPNFSQDVLVFREPNSIIRILQKGNQDTKNSLWR